MEYISHDIPWCTWLERQEELKSLVLASLNPFPPPAGATIPGEDINDEASIGVKIPDDE